MRRMVLILTLVAGTTVSSSAAWTPNERLLDAVCQVESNNGLFVIGDGGISRGHFQMQRAAWADVCQWRQRRQQETHSYERHVFDPNVSRTYAADYLTILHDQLKRVYRREPTTAEIYAAYNMGLKKFRQYNCDLAQVSPRIAARCNRVADLSKTDARLGS